jgi:hypothetical protein
MEGAKALRRGRCNEKDAEEMKQLDASLGKEGIPGILEG